MKVVVCLSVEVCVEVEDGATINEAEQVALFNIGSIVSSIPCDTVKKFIDIEIEDYTVHSVNEV